MRQTVFQALQQARAKKRPVALVTHLASGEQALVDALGKTLAGDLALSPEGAEDALGLIERDDSRVFQDKGLFVQVFNSPLRLIVVGAVHIAQALVPMAQLMGFAVTVIDPRKAWATAERFPGIELTYDWPDEAMERLAPDARTAIVALTHDPKLDDPALTRALASRAFYIGALGSKRTHEKRRQRLAEAGIAETDFARIDGPIGLAIGAKSPAEIALSILSKMTQVHRGAPPLAPAA